VTVDDGEKFVAYCDEFFGRLLTQEFDDFGSSC
jgi:hypothetical protein